MNGDLSNFTKRAKEKQRDKLNYYVSDIELAVGPFKASVKLSPKEKEIEPEIEK